MKTSEIQHLVEQIIFCDTEREASGLIEEMVQAARIEAFGEAAKPVDRGALWDAINEYVVSCGGNPSSHIYGNVRRMNAVVAVERVVFRDHLGGVPPLKDEKRPTAGISGTQQNNEGHARKLNHENDRAMGEWILRHPRWLRNPA